MAACDYRLCDVCGCKAFYDANLNYEDGTSVYAKHGIPYTTVGKRQYNDDAMQEKYGMRLDYLGDWAVICQDCSTKFKTAIVPVGV